MRITMSKENHSYLANHLVYIHHEKLRMIKGYSLDYDTYMGMLGYINSYIRRLEQLLDNAIVDEGDSSPPVLILGSTAVINNKGIKTEYSVVYPSGGHLSRQRTGAQIIIAGTPDADALLFKTAGEDVCLETLEQSGQIEQIIYDPVFNSEQYALENEQYAV